MTESTKGKSGDQLGIGSYGEALKIVSEESIRGIGNFLSKICMPAATEFGLLLRDRIQTWRLNNIARIIEKSKGRLKFEDGELQLQANPRLVMEIVENGSLQDNEYIQEMWAGLLAASCKPELDDSDIIYSQILNRLTVSQVKILEYYAVNSKKVVNREGVIETLSGLLMEAEKFFEIAGTRNTDKLSAEFSHLISLQLVETGFGLASGFFNKDKKDDPSETLMVGLKLSSLALILYVKCQGYSGSVKDFFKIEYRHGMKIGEH